MGEINEVTELLEHKLDKLLDIHSFLKDENEFLHKKLNSLEAQLTSTSQELEEKEKEYQLLKIAKTIEGSNKNTRDTKLKINALIRDIDTCIIQLSD